MIIEVDPESPVPAFEQVRAQLAEMILSGALPTGHRLPTIRQLATDLALAPGTVARVYRELESDGLVASRVRHGTVVAPVRRESAQSVRNQLAESARAFALSAHRHGVPLDAAVLAVREAWSELATD